MPARCFSISTPDTAAIAAGSTAGFAPGSPHCAPTGPHSPASPTSRTPPAVDLLAHFSLLDHFALVVGGDTLPRCKPDPLPLLHACTELGVAIEHSVFVGDSINDVQAARAAGMRIACVSYGYNHGRHISEAAPDAVVDSLEELASLCFGAQAATGCLPAGQR